MEIKILPAYKYTEEIKKLFSEYTELLINSDKSFSEYLKIQKYDREIENPSEKYGLPFGRLYIAFCEEKAVGCIGLKRMDKQNCEMKRLYVIKEYRKFGIGEKLVKLILSDAEKIGYRYIYLDTLPSLESAIRLYRKYGFYEIDKYNDSPVENTVYMRKDLK